MIAVICFAAMLPGRSFAQAPTISYGSPQIFTTHVAVTLTPTSSNVDAPTGVYGSPVILGSGLTVAQNGLAVDAAGNIYVNDQDGGGNGLVKKITADGSSTTTIGSGFSNQSANVAVDQAGNVYVADQAAVWKIPASGSPVVYGTPVVINSTFTKPFAIAADAAGNIYVGDIGAGVYKMANDGTNKVKIDNGIGSPSGLAVDAAGNVYAVDYVANALYEIPANGDPQVQLANGFGFPRGLGVDGAGTIYVDDENAQSIYAVPAGGGTPVAVVSGLTNLVGVAVDAGYNLYAALQANAGISKLSPTGGYFISPAALPAGLSFDNTTGIISGTPTNASAATDYVISAYNSSAGASATVNITVNAYPIPVVSYTSPQTYTAGTAITALTPTSTGVSAPGYCSTASTIASGFNFPLSIAVDGPGNIYVADYANNLVQKIPAGGGTPVSIGSGFSNPSGVAVDSIGNVYVADSGNGLVKEILKSGGAPVTIGTGFTTPGAVAVDLAGNVYVGDVGSGTVFKIQAAGGGTVTLAAGFSDPAGIAVDALGNLYVSDGSGGAVYRFKSKGGTVVNIGSTLGFPSNVAVDPAGNVFITETNSHSVYKVRRGRDTAVNLGAEFSGPSGVAVDGAGNVYVADSYTNLVSVIKPNGGYFLNRPLPAGLRLKDTTGVISGTPTGASPATDYTITAYNVGGSAVSTVNIVVNLPGVPTVSYTSPAVFTAGAAISPLGPTGTGVAAPGYGTSTVSLGSGFNAPAGAAVDKLGNVYVADAGNNAIKKIPAGGGTPVVVGSGFNAPTAVAIDTAGNIFVADQGNGLVKKIAKNSGVTTTFSSDFISPNGVAVDGAGNVYVTDAADNSVNVVEGCGCVSTFPGTFSAITAIAANARGDVYFTDGGAGQAFKLKLNGSVTNIGHSFDFPSGIAVNAVGDVFIADQGDNKVYEIPAGSHNKKGIGSGFNGPAGLAADSAGNVYVADTYNNAIEKITPVGGYFISDLLPKGLNFNDTTGVISGTPKVALAPKKYTITGYNYGGPTSFTLTIEVDLPPPPTITYASPHIYKQGVTIAQLAPTVSGISNPGYGSPVVLASGLNLPAGIALDRSGNIIVADPTVNRIDTIPLGGGTPVKIGGGFSAPLSVTTDAAGNVYVADGGNSAVKKIPADGSTPVRVGGFVFTYPAGVAADAAGNIYVADEGAGIVYKIPAQGGPGKPFNSDVFAPTSIAVDNAGNVYVTDSSIGYAYKIPAGGGTAVQIGPAFAVPGGIAVDGAGDVFITDAAFGTITELPAGGGAPKTIGSLLVPFGIAADAKGNLYITDSGDGTVQKISPTGGFFISPSLPAGLTFNIKTGVIGGTPTLASPATNYLITGYNLGGGRTDTVNIQVLSNNANLAKLKIVGSPLSPVFDPAITSYTASVTNGIANAVITPTASDSTATIKVNGHAVASGSAATPVPLNVGPNIINTVVTAQDGTTTQTYTITVTRGVSGNTDLSNLRINGRTLSPSFVYTTTDYTANVPYGTTSVLVTPNVHDPTASVTINGTPVNSGTASDPVLLSVGDNTIATVVTAADGTTKTYTVVITRAGSSNANLSNLRVNGQTMSPSFIFTTSSYTVNVPYATTSILVTPTAADPGAAITVNGDPAASGAASAPIALSVGDNTITTMVTAPDGINTKTYTITVTRAASPNAYLSNLRVNGQTISPSFIYSTAAYTANVPWATTAVQVTATTVEPAATITINGTAVVSHTASDPLPVDIGDNTITTVVTAPDGISTKTYTIVVTRSASPDADLTNLRIIGQTLSPAFIYTTTSYTASVTNATTSVQVIPTSHDAGATITINTQPVNSHASSDPITLNVGDNIITTVVTAPDGISTKTYTITVTRAAPGGMNTPYVALGVERPVSSPALEAGGISVRQGISPNGDGVNDVLTIDGIAGYPDNQLKIMNRNGTVVYEASGYDNTTKVFDGHSSKNGALQLPGTYFYSLDYKVKGIAKHKTGFIILKY